MTKPQQRIRSYVLRQAKRSRAQERAYDEHFASFAYRADQLASLFESATERGQSLSEVLFGNTNPLIIEIGFGMGHATAEIALKNPEQNFLGFEVHKPAVGALLARIVDLDLKNLRIIQADAVETLELFFRPNAVSGIHLFFPDPWPKKKHWKRRIFTEAFLKLCASFVLPQAYFYAATDWEPYAQWMLEAAENSPYWQNKYAGYAEKQAWRPMTSFEKKGIESSREIREILLARTRLSIED